MKKIKLKIILKINEIVRALAAYTHKLQFKYQWAKNPNPPEWFDHFMDQYFQMPKKQMSFWLERGVLNSLKINDGAEVLELCCGDGYNTKHFYANKAKHVLALDFDQTAIDHAKKFNSSENIAYSISDIRTLDFGGRYSDLAPTKFDNIIFDAAIEHFKEEEIKKILEMIKKSLKENGIFSGYTLIERDHESHHLHEYEFKSKEDLENMLKPYFKNIEVIYSKSKEGGTHRENLYFFADNK